MNDSRFYAVGLGPGDPRQLTRRAHDCLQRSERIYCPRSTRSDRSLSGELVRALEDVHAEVVEYRLEMHAPRRDRDRQYRETARAIADGVRQDRTLSAVSLGDVSVHSTLGPLLRAVGDVLPRTQIRVIPGISSFQAASSLLRTPLVQGDDRLAVVPALSSGTIETALRGFETVVFLKVNTVFPRLHAFIHDHRQLADAVLLEHMGTDEQTITPLDRVAPDRRPPYFSLVISYTGDERP